MHTNASRARGMSPARFAAAGLLAVLSVYLLFHGLRAAVAYTLYFQSKYGPAKDDTAAILRLNEKAYRLYPYNGYSCAWAAREAYGNALALTEQAREAGLLTTWKWCDRGLALDARNRDLRRLKSRLLRAEDLPAAVSNWESFVEWNFWEPGNHVFLAELYAEAGALEKAERTLAILKPHPRFHARAKRYVDAARGK